VATYTLENRWLKHIPPRHSAWFRHLAKAETKHVPYTRRQKWDEDSDNGMLTAQGHEIAAGMRRTIINHHVRAHWIVVGYCASDQGPMLATHQ
jgi:hypothetical protein